MAVAAIPIAAAVVGGMMGRDSARRAGNQQADAARESNIIGSQTADRQMALQREQFGRQEALTREQMGRDRQIYDELVARNEPGRQAGLRGLAGYEDQINQGFQFDPNAFSTERIMNDPGMQFRQQTGENTLRRQLNAGDGVYSGAAAKALLGYNSNLASQEYGAAYGRAADGEARRKDAYQLRSNQLANLAGIGQTANSASQVAGQNFGQAGQNANQSMGLFGANSVNQQTNALGNYGLNASGNAIGLGNARAGASMYQGNTWANALNQGASAWGRAGYGTTPAGNFGDRSYLSGAGRSGNLGWADQSYE